MSPTKPMRDILIEARATLADPARWTQDNYSIDRDGRTCENLDQTACRFCLYGAAGKAAGLAFGGKVSRMPPKYLSQVIDGAATRLARSKGLNVDYVSGIELNDGHIELPDMTPHQAVVAALDLAIAEHQAA